MNNKVVEFQAPNNTPQLLARCAKAILKAAPSMDRGRAQTLSQLSVERRARIDCENATAATQLVADLQQLGCTARLYAGLQ